MRKTLAAAALALALPATAQEVALRIHHFAAPEAPLHALLAAPWARRLEAESGGRLRIRVFPSMALGGRPSSLADQAKQGEVDIVYTMPAFTSGRFPKTEVFELPLLHGDAMSSTLALQDYFDKHLQEEYADYRVLLLHAHDGAVLHASRPVRRLEDFQGLKIRIANRGGAVLLRALGATAVGTPAGELTRMLAEGLLDGCLLPFSRVPAHRLETLARHHARLGDEGPGLGTSVFAFLMNPASYARLDPALRELVDAHSRRHLAWYAGKSWTEAAQAGIAAARGAGNAFVELSAAERKRVQAAVAPELARTLSEISRRQGFDAAGLYADAEAMIQRYRE